MRIRIPAALIFLLCGCGQSSQGADASVPSIDAARDARSAPPDRAAPIDGSLAGDLDSSVPDGACPPPPVFNYQCDPKNPATCPAGFCIFNQCVAGQFDSHQFDNCGDGVCSLCETAANCPADCGAPPVTTGAKVYDDPNTITVWLHGFTNHTAATLKTTTYGAVMGWGDIGAAAATYGVNRPCGADSQLASAPNQIVGVEYYGAIPPSWMSQQDVMEVEQYPYLGGPTGLQRYGLIVAKFIKWKMAQTGATHVNLACHSMGCLLARYVIENDVEHLASSNVFVRWVTSSGVIAGAQLARLYNNPSIQMFADQIGLAVDDFALMNPDYV